MHFNFKGTIIILVIILLVVAYKFGTPYFKKYMLHWKTQDLYENFTDSKTPWKVIGQSTEGRDIYGMEIGQDSSVTIIFGAFHGDEQAGFHLVTQLADTLYQNPNLINSRVLLVPVVNPDGLMARTRVNANGVDLNRNFPTEDWTPVYKERRYFPGPSGGSEVETQFVMELMEKNKPSKIVSIHDDLHMNNYNGPALELGKEMARYNNYPVEGDVGYPTPGSYGTYGGYERNIPLITLELPAIGPDEAWEQNKDALIAAINFKNN